MSVPLSQMWTVASYVIRQKLKGRARYPLVLMLEPLFRCNLACAGCGKIQYPPQILRKDLTVEQCLKAADECGAPMVSIPGGEPLMYPEIGPLVEALVARKKYVYLCTNAILLKDRLQEGVFRPSKFLSFSVHMDGLKEEHDDAVCRDGVYGVQLLEGAGPGALPPAAEDPGAVPQDAGEPEAAMEVQSVTAVPAIPHGQAGLRVHALGQSHVQHLRMAASLLPLAGRLRRDLRGADPDDTVGAVRPGEWQRQMPGLHGALRLRAHRREPHVQLAPRLPRHCRRR